MDNIILETKDLCKKYGTQLALNHVNIQLQRGQIIGLLGPNGSGKTTLIKLINSLLTPSSGEILVNGKKPGPDTKLVVSYLPDKNYLNGAMTVRQLFTFYQDFFSDFNMDKAYEMLNRLGIADSTKFRTMSKGTKEKVQLILTMSREADLYCLDEPIGGVDPASRDYILETIIRNYNENASVIISTHLIADVESVLDDIIFLQNGNIRLHATVDEIREKEGKSVDALFREVFRC